MTERDLSAFFDDGALDYPGVPSRAHPEGKTYRVPSPDAQTGLWLATLADIGRKAAVGGTLTKLEEASLKLDDEQEQTLYQRVLGNAYDEMLADGVPWTVLKRIHDDAYMCFAMDQDLADSILDNLGKLKARSNRALKKTKSTPRKTAGSKSAPVSTGTPDLTQSQASTLSLTSPSAPEATKKAV